MLRYSISPVRGIFCYIFSRPGHSHILIPFNVLLMLLLSDLLLNSYYTGGLLLVNIRPTGREFGLLSVVSADILDLSLAASKWMLSQSYWQTVFMITSACC